MKTIKEWLETLPDGYRERALKNLTVKSAKAPVKALSVALSSAFIWADAPEKHDFWRAVRQWAFQPDTHPLPPLPFLPDKSEFDALLSVAQAALEYIDALPKDLILPTMPGFDREWADQVIERAKAR